MEYTGTTTVNDGTLKLNKPSGPAIIGPLVIGDDNGGPGSDAVAYGSAATNNQIANDVAITFNSSALLDLSGASSIVEEILTTAASTTLAAQRRSELRLENPHRHEHAGDLRGHHR